MENIKHGNSLIIDRIKAQFRLLVILALVVGSREFIEQFNFHITVNNSQIGLVVTFNNYIKHDNIITMVFFHQSSTNRGLSGCKESEKGTDVNEAFP